MGWRVIVAIAAVAASLVATASAAANTYQVLGTADLPDPPLCEQIQPTLYNCPTLRSAVFAANANPGPDVIGTLNGTYNLQLGALTIVDDVTLVGSGARATTIASGGTDRVLSVDESAVDVFGATIADGDVSSGTGGNIAVGPGATLTLIYSRVTRGTAEQGAGIFNEGSLNLIYSLVDNNEAFAEGGAIYSSGGLASAPEVNILESTLAANEASAGAGIYSAGNVGNTILLTHATIARNSGGGLAFDAQQDVTMWASIIAANGGLNCAGGQVSAGQGMWSVESGTDCGLTDPSNRRGTNAGIAPQLTNAGGPTDVLTIPADSVAADLSNPCLSPTDQRGFIKQPNEPCDAGAYDHAATADQPPQETPTPTPTPTAAIPTPAPSAAPAPTPTPVANQTVVVREVSGKVKIKLRGTNRFVDFDATKGVPLGSEIDTRKGRIELISVPKPGAPPERATFYAGIFRVTQSRGITVLTLTERLAACPKRGRAAAAAKKPKKRRLWGEGKGAFRTSGKYAAATVRGTKWLVEDSCAGTRVRVTRGAVTVRDNVKKKNVVLRAPKSYLAKPK